MNPKLVICLFASVPIGLLAALASLAAGGGVLVALLTYCAGGSLALVTLALALQAGEAPRPAATRVALPPPRPIPTA